MRFLEVGEIIIQREPGTTRIMVGKGQATINLDAITSYRGCLVPSDLTGPDGSPVQRDGTKVHLGADVLIIDVSEKDFKYALEHGELPVPEMLFKGQPHLKLVDND